MENRKKNLIINVKIFGEIVLKICSLYHNKTLHITTKIKPSNFRKLTNLSLLLCPILPLPAFFFLYRLFEEKRYYIRPVGAGNDFFDVLKFVDNSWTTYKKNSRFPYIYLYIYDNKVASYEILNVTVASIYMQTGFRFWMAVCFSMSTQFSHPLIHARPWYLVKVEIMIWTMTSPIFGAIGENPRDLWVQENFFFWKPHYQKRGWNIRFSSR